MKICIHCIHSRIHHVEIIQLIDAIGLIIPIRDLFLSTRAHSFLTMLYYFTLIGDAVETRNRKFYNVSSACRTDRVGVTAMSC